jgi:hypothetical protein
MDYSPIVTTAARLLASRFGRPVELSQGEVYTTWMDRIQRCHVLPPREDLPETVIVKHSVPRPEPEHADWHLYAILNDWAAGIYLGGINGYDDLAPRLYGSDLPQRIVVMEDLGTGTTLDTFSLLFGKDADFASASLLEHVALLGRLHAATCRSARDYLPIREGLGTPEPELPLYCNPWSRARLRSSTEDELGDAIRRYRVSLEAVNISPSSGADSEIALVTAEIEDQPDAFLAYCKGDQEIPNDAIRVGSRLRLYDFNVGGLRHALIEGMPGWMTWGCHMRFPIDLIAKMDDVYQQELAQGCPATADEKLYRRARTLAAARWHLFHVTLRLPEALRADVPRGTMTTLRQQFLAWTDAFVKVAMVADCVPNLTRTARQLAIRLRSEWPSEVHSIPYYPVFQR